MLEDLLLSRATVDRGAQFRTESGWLEQRLSNESTRVLLVHEGSVPVSGDAVQWLNVQDIHQAIEHYLIGVDDTGAAYIAARVEQAPQLPMSTLREMGSRFNAHDAGLVTTAVALARWHASHTHCPRCGAPTEVVNAGWARRCAVDSTDHFPRTDPAVIALVIHGDRALLGRRFDWPANRFSCFAGFVEAGESSENALVREIAEECGLQIDRSSIEYLGSQPWPFPASLMLGYHVYATSTEAIADGDEITDVRWFTRDELNNAMADSSVVLPPAISIARRLIEKWLNEPR